MSTSIDDSRFSYVAFVVAVTVYLTVVLFSFHSIIQCHGDYKTVIGVSLVAVAALCMASTIFFVKSCGSTDFKLFSIVVTLFIGAVIVVSIATKIQDNYDAKLRRELLSPEASMVWHYLNADILPPQQVFWFTLDATGRHELANRVAKQLAMNAQELEQALDPASTTYAIKYAGPRVLPCDYSIVNSNTSRVNN